MKQLTKKQAIDFGKSGIWKKWTQKKKGLL